MVDPIGQWPWGVQERRRLERVRARPGFSVRQRKVLTQRVFASGSAGVSATGGEGRCAMRFVVGLWPMVYPIGHRP